MLSPPPLRLAMAVLLSISVLVALGLTLDVGHTAPAKPLKAKLLRPANSDSSKLTDAEKDYLRTHAAVQEEKKDEREFDNKVPDHLPIKVKLRPEKEKAAKDLANDRWHRDLEIEIQNTGDKPIYYISLIFEMTEIKINGGSLTFGMRYGEHTLFDGSKGRAKPEDIPLMPKEVLILSIDAGQARGWEIAKDRDKWPQPNKIAIIFEELNFGDGTGFFGDNGTPWPLPGKSQSPQKAVFAGAKKEDYRSHHSYPRRRLIAWDMLIGGESASSWPTSFRLTELLTTPYTADYK